MIEQRTISKSAGLESVNWEQVLSVLDYEYPGIQHLRVCGTILKWRPDLLNLEQTGRKLKSFSKETSNTRVGFRDLRTSLQSYLRFNAK